ncbi:DUF805 domain-containing protein [Brevibacterium linens]|uniref:Uncharacterized membrane protein YhaH, DUF805 family n=1 Tax=Brevibacterium linens ATCC 9172 TaxID=1255617 RepID=A0A2H1IV01_BRELN|nr:DUF805 domain-containing protein [Brevibacterium linens]SMX79033.1 Uncharacterized membrane protein YhaH, DUF805 family [Brevibacterium linens ATCC 9172]
MSYDANAAYNSGTPGQGAPGAGVPVGQGYGGQGFGGAPRGAASPDDLSLPLYGASFGQAVKRFFKNYVNFKGRASRSEYWFAALFVFLLLLIPGILSGIGAAQTLSAAAGSIDPATGQMNSVAAGGGSVLSMIGGTLSTLIGLALFIPQLAISWRRLHDANLAGPFWFLGLIPFVGGIILIVLMVLPSKPEGQRFDV